MADKPTHKLVPSSKPVSWIFSGTPEEWEIHQKTHAMPVCINGVWQAVELVPIDENPMKATVE